MKKLLNRLSILLMITVIVIVFDSCQKEIKKLPVNEEETMAANSNSEHGHLKQTKIYPSTVAQKWHDLQIRILRLPAGPNIYGLHGNRYFSYLGVALYESVVPGMPAYQSLYGQLSGLPQMPSTQTGMAYHWPTCANAALAFLTKNYYTLAPAALQTAIDSLDNALKTEYQQQTNAATFQRSENFGKQVAQLIFDWSKTDGALTTYPPYVPTTDPNLWSPTPPNPTAVFAPYWGQNRLFVPGSNQNTSSPPPPPYSTDSNSAYFQMVKEVYDISQTLTPAQTATALYFRDNPGFQAGTHYQYIFNQVMHVENPQLDAYALAQAKTGMAMADAQIDCWKIKYNLIVDRPTKYIRNVMGHTTWTSLFAMPPHPDFPSGHSQTGGAFAEAMTKLFGDNYSIVLHTYDNLGMAPRPYSSFYEMADDIGMSRVYAGIHYRYSCEEGNKQGKKIAQNILNILRFEKDE